MDAATLRERLTASGREALRGRIVGEPPEASSGADTLFRARYGCYVVLDFEPEQAFALAMAADTSVLEALRLLEDGCPHETAVAILA